MYLITITTNNDRKVVAKIRDEHEAELAFEGTVLRTRYDYKGAKEIVWNPHRIKFVLDEDIIIIEMRRV